MSESQETPQQNIEPYQLAERFRENLARKNNDGALPTDILAVQTIIKNLQLIGKIGYYATEF